MPSTRAVASQIVGEYFHGSTFDLHFIPAEFDEAVGQQQEGQEGQQGNQQGTGMPENGNQQEQQVEQNQRKEKHYIIQSPYQIRPICSMPQTTDQKDDKRIKDGAR